MKRPTHKTASSVIKKSIRHGWIASLAVAISLPVAVNAAPTDHDDFLMSVARIRDEAGLNIPDTRLRGNAGIIKQEGDDNRASIVQQRNGTQGFGNLAYIDQNGNNNEANINQEGSYNLGWIEQTGDDHSATINQQGSTLKIKTITMPQASIYQYGSNSDITISQSRSDGRGISVEQHSYSGAPRPITIDTY